MTPNEDFFILNNFYQILFGLSESVCTFEYPIRFKGEAAPKSSWLFLCLSFCICLFFIKEWRCNYHKGLKTFALESGWIMASATPFFVAQNYPIRFKMKNNTIKLPSNDGKLPDALQSAISEFFTYNGSPSDIEKLQWEMLQSATAGVEEIGLNSKSILEFMFLYRTSKALFNQLHSFHNQTIELCNN